MEVRFNSDLEARLTKRATRQGCDPDEFVQDVVARFLEEEDRFVEAVQRGEEALKKGDYLSHEQVGERLHRFLHKWKSVGPCQPQKTSNGFANG